MYKVLVCDCSQEGQREQGLHPWAKAREPLLRKDRAQAWFPEGQRKGREGCRHQLGGWETAVQGRRELKSECP